jgi:LPXTG-motif cell wall-anchored protein
MPHTLQRAVGRMLILVALIVFAVAGRDASAAHAQQSTVNINIQDFKFDPATLTVAAGTTVTWTNLDTAPHTATSTTTGVFDTGTLQKDQSGSVTLTQAGTFDYLCAIHPNMVATLTVTAAAPAPAPAPEPAPAPAPETAPAPAPETAPSDLPNTGANDQTGLLTVFGVLVLLSGVALTSISRRRMTIR